MEVKDLVVRFFTDDGEVFAVNGVSFEVYRGEVLGIVGESGCGKSVTASTIMRIVPIPPGKILGGQVIFEGVDLLKLPEREMRKIRGDRIAMVFQDPMTSFNPLFTIGEQIMEALILHRNMDKKEARREAIKLLGRVGIPEPEKRVDCYPHEFSGGMRQRAMIAMALACKPDLLIADEPTTALDVTIQAQILRLMMHLQRQENMATILITHDLGIVAEVADRVAVMYAGYIMEYADVFTIFDKPQHPYTLGLLRSVPSVDRRSERLEAIRGQPPDLLNLPEGCPFAPRCPYRKKDCDRNLPPLFRINEKHLVRCWLAGGNAVEASA